LCDNAWPNTAHTTANLLDTWHWEILPLPSYSPDLATSDFHLFLKLKKHLRGLRLQTHEDVEEELKLWLHLQEASFYHRRFDFWSYPFK
jgi:histone-lysine N-methyltransferase SETMAR